jgi:transposase
LNFKIHFTTQTLSVLSGCWQAALKAGQNQLLKRISALQLLSDQLAPAVIAQRLQVAVSTVYAWLAAFMQHGVAALKYGAKRGRKAKLSQAQLVTLTQKLLAGPTECGYKSGMWSGVLVAELIEREFKQHYHPRYVPSLLRELGFSYQKACFISDHLDPLRRTEWLESEWPGLVKEAREQKALLLFGDEASFAQWGSLSYTWAIRGHQPVVATTGIRKAYKVFGLLDYFTGELFYSGHTERFNATSYCEFLKGVLEQTPSHQKIMVVQDGARYHTARTTKEFIAAHASRLSVYQLPAYSPDYNPIEHLWRRIKRKATHNRYFEKFEDLIASVEAALAELVAQPGEVLALAGTVLDKWAA